MDSFLTVATRLKGRLSLSCNDLSAIESEYDDFDSIKQLRRNSKSTSCPWTRRRFLTSEYSDQSLDRAKSKSSELVNALDDQLAEIREKLAMLREQDIDFHERMDSLSNSIGEVASQSSLSSFGSALSEASEAASDGIPDDADENAEEKNYTEDEQIIKSKIEGISKSFSNELLNSIPTIKVTSDPYKRKRSSKRSVRRSDPYIHGSAELLNSFAESNRHSICLTDHAYLYGSGEEISTFL